MKIASKKFRFPVMSGAALGLVLALGAGYAWAQTTSAVATETSSAVVPSFDVPAPSMTPSALPLGGGNTPANRTKTLNALEDKVSDSAKNVVKQLSSVDTVNLDDMNTARQTVAKLDILIEIEKRLADLDKIHNDHSGEKALAAAIPASALSLPTAAPLYPSAGGMPGSEPAAMPSYMPKKLDVTRIVGSDGHYSAMIQGKIMRVGDSMSDGSTIVAITNKEVTTKAKNGALHQLKVKGVNEVYGHTL